MTKIFEIIANSVEIKLKLLILIPSSLLIVSRNYPLNQFEATQKFLLAKSIIKLQRRFSGPIGWKNSINVNLFQEKLQVSLKKNCYNL